MQSDSAEETLQRLTFSLSELEQLGETIVSGRGNFSVSSKTYLRVILGTLGVTRGAILRFHPIENHLTIETSINVVDESLVIPVIPDDVAIILQASIIDVSQPPHSLKPFLDGIQPQLQILGANLWATLKIREEFLGIISLGAFFNSREMDDWDRGILNVLANQTSIAIAYSRLMDEIRADKFRFVLLSDITTEIGKLLDAEHLEEEVVNHAVSLLDASAGCLMLINPLTQRLEMKSHFALDSRFNSELKDLSIALKPDPSDDEAGQAVHPVLSILREVTTKRKTLIHNDEEAAPLLHRKNLMAAPIFGREILGVLVACDKEGRGGITLDFTSEDEFLLEAFANQAGVAIENARLYQEALERRRLQAEMEEAATIQKNLLPEAPPEIPGYEVAGICIPHGGVGGDYYDYIPEPNGRWGLAIADVSGKGMQAALLMATLRAGLLSEVARRKDLPSMAITLNSLLCESSTMDKFATFCYAQLHPETGILTSINAAHNYPMVIRSDGSLKRLEKGGVMLGMFPDDMIHQVSTYEQETSQLNSGDIVLFYTDGVTETLNPNDELYGEERLEKITKQLRGSNANEICTAIHNAVLEFQGEAQQFDDLTLMVLKKK